MYIQKKLNKKIRERERERENNLNPYMRVIVIFFLIVPCIYTGYTLIYIIHQICGGEEF